MIDNSFTSPGARKLVKNIKKMTAIQAYSSEKVPTQNSAFVLAIKTMCTHVHLTHLIISRNYSSAGLDTQKRIFIAHSNANTLEKV